jgi:hypothetical protein
MTTPVNNVDDILVPREQAMLANEQIPAQPAPPELEQPQEPVRVVPEEDKKASIPEQEPVPQDDPYQEAAKAEPDPVKAEKSPIDEYGNPVEKPRMYTEEELQQRIRERLSRGKHQEPVTQQQVNQEAKNFTPDPNSDESWEVQLEAFVERTIDKRQKKLSEQEWQAQEQARQSEFEDKFTSGMGKYQDFHQVVSKVPITNGVMLASRALDNPAAFVYAAAKLHPQELERISKISDPYAQSAEVGRLHERMVKARNAVSKAPKPIEAPKGDVPQNSYTRPPLEALIEQHAKQKRAR